MNARLSFAAGLLIFCLADSGRPLAIPIDADAAQSVGGVERVERGPSFAAEDLVTRSIGSVSTPRFDASAGVFGSGGIQPATATPENLSGSYSAPPPVREVSASVMVADSFADGAPASGGPAASGSGIRFSPQNTAAPRSANFLWGNRAASAGLAGVAQSAAFARRSGSLTRSSVFLDNESGTSGRSTRARPADGSGGSATALGTVQAASSLTVYQALHDAATDAGANGPAGKTIEAYNVAASGTPSSPAAATVRMPMKVTSSSYGFLNSSLTVFSDDFGTFAGVGQTFNGLTSLNIAEPASAAVLLGSLAGIAALRRRKRR